MSARAEITAATPADLTQLLALIRQLAAYERLLDSVIADEQLLFAGLFGPAANAEAVLARLDGCVVGFALYFHNFSTFLGRRGLYLEDLFVIPEARGQGIGKQLLSHLARLAVQRGCGRFEWAVLDWNEPAIRFYQSLGARPNDDWTVYRLDGEALTRLA